MIRLFILLLLPVVLKSQPVHIVSYELDYNFAFDTSDAKVILRLKGDLNVLPDGRSVFYQVQDREYNASVLMNNHQFMMEDSIMYILKNPSSNQLYFKDFTPVAMDKWIADSLHPFSWDISNDTLHEGGVVLQKASTRFRGRLYTAWFNPEVPIPNGPWKFGGLPGLIYRVSDEHRFFVYRLTGIVTQAAATASYKTPKKPILSIEKYAQLTDRWLKRYIVDLKAADAACESCSTEIKHFEQLEYFN